MKKKRLKKFVLPSLFIFVTVSIITGILIVSYTFSFNNGNYKFGISALKKEVQSVVKEEEEVIDNEIVLGPANDIPITISFYSKDDDEAKQQNSIIFYENTYLKNTGLIYSSDGEFEIKASLTGTVVEVEEDEIFGTSITIDHDNNLRTVYYGIKDVEVSKGDIVNSNTILGVSNVSKIENNKYTLLFETYLNNKLVNPENILNKDINSLS